MAEADWRPICTPIRDQGQCGSCTAFGTIGAWEGLLKLAGEDKDLSERDLFFCEGGTCNQGAEATQPLEQAMRGVCYESFCPYDDTMQGIDHSCGEGRAVPWKGKKIKGFTVLNTPAEMKAALDKGPVVSTMQCHQSFLNYIDGVYHTLGFWDPFVGGHMIAIVGYSDEKQAWLLRNSWTTMWGILGYCWIQYGDSNIDATMYALELEPGEIENNEPGPEPPSDCPVARFAVWFLNGAYALFGRKTRFRSYVP